MIIRIDTPPVLVPYHRVNGWQPERAPPVRMREVWIGRVLVASPYAPMRCHDVPKKDITVLDLMRKRTDGRPDVRIARRYGKEPVAEPMFLVEWKKGLMTVASMNVTEFVYEWYRSRWPAECDFVFGKQEATVLEA